MQISLGEILRMEGVQPTGETVRWVRLPPCKWAFWPPWGDCRHRGWPSTDWGQAFISVYEFFYATSTPGELMSTPGPQAWETDRWKMRQVYPGPQKTYSWHLTSGDCWCQDSSGGRKISIEESSWVKWLGLIIFHLMRNSGPKKCHISLSPISLDT